MEDIDELSKKLFQNKNFLQELKTCFNHFQQDSLQTSTNEQIKLNTESGNANFDLETVEQEGLQSIERKNQRNGPLYKKQSFQSACSLITSPMHLQFTLNELTSEIASLITEIIKKQCIFNVPKLISPLPPQSNKIDELLEKMVEIQNEQSSLLKKHFLQETSSIRSQIENKMAEMTEKLNSSKKNQVILEKMSQVKRERTKVAKQILQISKKNQQSFPSNHIKEPVLSLSGHEDEEMDLAKKTSELNAISSKISEVEKSQVRISQQIQDKIFKEVQRNVKDVQSLTEKILSWKIQNQEKLESGFTGIWNVVSNIEDKLNKTILRVLELEELADQG